METKIWFITGVSSGLGRHLLEEVAKSGDTVIGTVRKEDQVKEIDRIVPGKTFGILLDVTDYSQVNKVVKSVIEEYKRIDVLVNNAGYGLVGAIEEVSMQEARQQMETNFFGALAVCQAFLPYLRKQKRGHIIQVSSQAGMSSAPGLGIYNASKYALEGFSEAMYKELAPLGIKVTLVEPGPFRTEWAAGSMKHAGNSIDDYNETAGKVKENLAKVNGKQPGDPVRAARAIIKIAGADVFPFRLALGKGSVETIIRKLEWVGKELNDWKELSIDTDFQTDANGEIDDPK